MLKLPKHGLAYCLDSVLNVKALVGTFNQERALVGAFSVIVKTDGLFLALLCTGPKREIKEGFHQT